MQRKKVQQQTGRRCCSLLLCVFLATCSQSALAREDVPLSDSSQVSRSKKQATTTLAAVSSQQKDLPAATHTAKIQPQSADKEEQREPEQTGGTSSSKILLYTGIGVGVVALAAWGISSGSGSSDNGSGSSSSDNDSTLTPVCVSISGTWSGYLDLVGAPPESITATIKQNGASVDIKTSSSQAYGKRFIGIIERNCTMMVYDQITGEDWSSHGTTVTAKGIELYDYVGNPAENKLDHLHLVR